MPEEKRRSVSSVPRLALVMVALIVLAQATARWTDHQLANLASYLMAFLALLSVIHWWHRRTAGRPKMRWVPLGTGLGLLAAGVVVLAANYKVVGVTGDLVPVFRSRFADRAPLAENPQPIAQPAGAVMHDQGFHQFLGPDRSGRLERRAFRTDLQAHPPRRLWSQAVGNGLAGVAVVPWTSDEGDESTSPEPSWVCITMEQRDKEEWVTCYDLKSGQLRWYHAMPGYHSHPLGDIGPRSTPTVDDAGRVYALGATGLLRCLDGVTGDLLWHADLLEMAGLTQERSESMVTWGRAASPLVVDDKIVVPLGGDPESARGSKTLVALHRATGQVAWTSGTHQISYASPVLATLAEQRQILTVDEGFASGCDPENGNVLWTTPWDGSSSSNANCSNPVPYGTDRVLLSKGYGGGARLIRLVRTGNTWETQEEWSNPRVLKTKFTNVVIQGQYAYGLSDGTLQCVDMETGEEQWRQSRGDRFGHGHILIVEDCLLATTEEGEVVLAEATPREYQELARFQAVDGKTWNPPSVLDNYVIVRNGLEMAVWELPRRGDTAQQTSDDASDRAEVTPAERS